MNKNLYADSGRSETHMVVQAALSFVATIARLVLYLLGAFLIVLALWMFYVAAGVAQWVPVGIAIAGLVVIAGLLIIGAADRATMQ